MAPEQLEGGVADARSDQFSFCVTAWEALFGARPFAAVTLAGLVDEMRAGRISRPGSGAPAWLRRILRRGLSFDAAQRWPSMDSLLTALIGRERRRRRRITALVAAGLVTVAAVVALQLVRRSQLCSGSAAKWDPIWSAQKQDSLHAAFIATNLPYAEDEWRGFQRSFERYRDAWVMLHKSTCEATRLRGEQSEEVLGLRMMCLDDRLESAAALGALLEHADDKAVLSAISAAGKLPEIDRCRDDKVLRARVPPPADADRERVQALADRRARVEALDSAGRYPEALQLARPLAEEARALGYRPLEAQTFVTLGDAADGAADYPAAESALKSALLAAEAGGDLEASVRAQVLSINVLGQRLHRFPEAHAAADHARALLERLGSPQLSAALDENLGSLDSEEGKYPDARAALERALSLREKLDPESTETAATLNSLGNLARQMGDSAGAVQFHQRALALFEKALGPLHPKVAQAVRSVGNDHWETGDLAEALSRYQRAVSIQERALGPDHPDTNASRGNIAAVYTQLGKFDEALAEYRRVLASNEKRLGPDSARLLMPLNNIAVTLLSKASLVEAESYARRALAIAEKTYGPVHPEVEVALVNLGDILLSRLQFDASVAAYRRAIAISESVVGPNHPHTGEDLGGLGFVFLAQNRPREALPILERAVKIGDPDPVNASKIRFALARALGKTPRALSLAKEAREVLAKSGGRQARDVKEIDAWLAKNQ
jgi:tetratricopeptide (TPR) repeat protein